MVVELVGATAVEVRGFTEPGVHIHGDAEGEGFGALQMFGASLALCAAAVLEAYAEGPLQTDPSDLRLRLDWRYGDRPRRIDRIAFEVEWPGLAPDRRNAVHRAVETCILHRTLEYPPPIITRVTAPDERSESAVPGGQ